MSKHILEIGTDGAAICAYDPSILPDDFDEKFGGDRTDLIEELAGDGRAWHDETGGDGSYIVHVYLEEAPNLEPQMEELVIETSEFRPFSCPSGRLIICGAEYVMKDFAADEPDLVSQTIQVPQGDYRLKFHRLEMDSERERRQIKPIWQTRVSDAAILIVPRFAIVGLFFLISGLWSSVTYLYRWATDFLPCPCQRTPVEIVIELGKAAASGLVAWLGFQANKAILNSPEVITHLAQAR